MIERRAGAVAAIAPDAPLAERVGQVFMGTVVATGTGRAQVTATGMRTQLGAIAHLLSQTEAQETPLQRQLAAVGRKLAIACVAIVAVVALLGVIQERPWLEVLMSAVSLAVAAVPEGLTAVVTIALAIGVTRSITGDQLGHSCHSFFDRLAASASVSERRG